MTADNDWNSALNEAQRTAHDRARAHLRSHFDKGGDAGWVGVLTDAISGVRAKGRRKVDHCADLRSCIQVIEDIRLLRNSGRSCDSDEFASAIADALNSLPDWPPAGVEYDGTVITYGPDLSFDTPYEMTGYGDAEQALEPTWLIPGIATCASLTVIYGAPGAGKSWLACDMALHMATGKAWRGNSIARSGVLYVAAEGAQGLRSRARMWAIANPAIRSAPFAIVEGAGALAGENSRGHWDEWMRDFAESNTYPASLIIIDTLAAALGGADENSAAAMGDALNACRHVQRTYGAAVILLHHPGRDAARGPRGHSSLAGAADGIVRVSDLGGGRRIATVEKLRDSQAGAQLPFRLETQDGITVVRHEEQPAAKLGRHKKVPPVDHCATLAASLIAAHAAGTPFAMHGRRGIYSRRAELPPEFNTQSRGKLVGLCEAAIQGGEVSKDYRGMLIASPAGPISPLLH